MANTSTTPFLLFLFSLAMVFHSLSFLANNVEAAGSWCIARSGASQTSLQTSLDYACGAGADCGPIQASALCYLPNTIHAHASYAFNSYYQRSNYAPGSCDFAGSATITISDPSYGSCTYPSSPSSAGGVLSPPVGTTTPISNSPTTPTTPTNGSPATLPANGTIFGGGGAGGFGSVGGISPGLGPGATDFSGTNVHSPQLLLLCLLHATAASLFIGLFM